MVWVIPKSLDIEIDKVSDQSGYFFLKISQKDHLGRECGVVMVKETDVEQFIEGIRTMYAMNPEDTK